MVLGVLLLALVPLGDPHPVRAVAFDLGPFVATGEPGHDATRSRGGVLAVTVVSLPDTLLGQALPSDRRESGEPSTRPVGLAAALPSAVEMGASQDMSSATANASSAAALVLGRPAGPSHMSSLLSGVHGGSFGLALALEVLDGSTPGRLTDGTTAATGALTAEGLVGGIGEVDLKVAAVRRAGATLFLVPEANVDQARSSSPGSTEVVGVSSLAQAVEELCTRGSRDALCATK